MINLKLNPEEAKLLLDFLQNATINSINGNAMVAMVKVMDKIAVSIRATEDPHQGE